MKLTKNSRLRLICKFTKYPLIILLVYILTNITSNIYCSSNFNKIVEEMDLKCNITFPNSYVGETELYNLGLYNYMYSFSLYKNINGHVIPSLKSNGSEGLLGTNYSSFNMSKSISNLDNLNWNNRKYTNLGLRQLIFISPNNELTDIVDDRKLLDEISSEKTIEVSISFDKPYDFSYVTNLLDNNLTSFYWINTNTNSTPSHDILDNIYLESDVIGIKLKDKDNNKIENCNEDFFIDILENLRLSKYQSLPYDKIYSSIAGDDNILEKSDIQISGAVLVGNKTEILKILSNDIVKYVFIGTISDKY